MHVIMSDAKPDPNQRPYKPEVEFNINDLETLKVLADPLRLQIVELCTKLYRHIKQLEERALIKVVDTRIVSGIVEKQYQAAAFNYRVDRELFSLTSQAGKEGLNVMLTGLFDDTREDIQNSAEADVLDVSPDDQDDKPLNRSLLISRNTLHLPPDVAETFYHRLKDLVREYTDQSAAASTDEQSYGLLIALYPSTGAASDSEAKP